MEDFETSVNMEEAADLSQPEEVTSEVTDVDEHTEPTAVEEPAKPQQTAEENSRYAEARRQAEAEARAIRAQNERLLSVLREGFGYEGTPEEVADALMAQTQNITVEEAREQREAQERENEQLLKAQSEIEYFKNIALEKFKADDLSRLKTTYPEDQKIQSLKDLNDLGPEFFSLMGALRQTGIDTSRTAILAYDTIKTITSRETKPIPQDIGAVNSSSSKEKDFYTSAEVDKLSKKQLSDPKIMQRVLNSMPNWK